MAVHIMAPPSGGKKLRNGRILPVVVYERSITVEIRWTQFNFKTFCWNEYSQRSSLLREMVYSSLRFGLYEPIRDAFAKIGPVSLL